MSLRRTLKRIAIVIGALLVVVFVAGFFVLRSRTFHQFVLGMIENRAAQALGTKVQIGQLTYDLPALRVDLYRVVVRGAEPNPAQPLLRVNHLELQLKIISLLGMKFGIRTVEIDRPMAHLIVGANGQSNLPAAMLTTQPGKPGSSTSNPFSLAVDHFGVHEGEIIVNDHQLPVDAALQGLHAQGAYNSQKHEYDAFLAYRYGNVQLQQFAPLGQSLQANLIISAEGLRADPLVIRAPESSMTVRATLRDYSQPVINGSYSVYLAAAEAAKLARSAIRPAGKITSNGVFTYASAPNRSLLDSVSLSGVISSPRLFVRVPQGRGQVRAFSGRYSVESGNLTVNQLAADVFGGRLVANASIDNLAGTPHGTLAASLKSLSIGALRAALPASTAGKWGKFPVGGTVNAAAKASWRGALEGLRVSADAALNGLVTVESARQTSQAIPLHGAVDAVYNARAQTLDLRQGILRTPQSEIDLKGSLGKNAVLTVVARSRDLRETDELITEVRQFSSTSSARIQLLNVSGSASFRGLVQGSLNSPTVTGQIAANDLRVEEEFLPHMGARVAVSPAKFSLTQGQLTAAHGSAAFRASVALRNWAHEPSLPASLELTANQMSVAALESVAHVKYPVKGLLSAQLSIHGSEARPAGSGTIQITKAEAWNQPLEQVTLRFQGTGTQVESNLGVETPGGAIAARLTYQPETEAYQAQLSAPVLNLGKLRLLRSLKISGIATASAAGQGTLKVPALDASLSIPELRVGQQTIKGVSARMAVANQLATINFNSNFSGIPAHATGTINLTDNYEAMLNLSTGTIEAGPLLSTYLPEGGGTVQFHTQLEASLRGPLKDPQQIQARIEIPTLRLAYQGLQISSVSAIVANYRNGMLVLNPFEIKGSGTDFHFQGSAPVESTGAMSARATGQIDLHLLQLFEPTLASSGELQLNIAAHGTLNSPQVKGQARVVNAAFVPPGAPLGIQNMNGTIAFNSTRAEIRQLTAQAGGGQVTATGSIGYVHGMQFNLAVAADNVRMSYPEGVHETLATRLTLVGTEQAGLISGQVLINDAYLSPQFDVMSFTNQFNVISVPSGPPTGLATRIKLNVAVLTSHQLTLTSDQLSISGSANLRVQGTIADPVVVGRTTLASGGSLLFNGNRFRIENGTIEFVNPVMTEPVLNVRVATTVDQYDVTLTFSGPVDRMRTTYSSSPPLASADIISLLISGHPTEAPNTGIGAESVLAQGLGEVSSRALKLAGISSLTIDPTVGGYQTNPGVNIAMQKQVTKNLFFTFSVNTALSEDDTVQVQYQVTPKWAVEALRDPDGGYSLEVRSHRSF
jgi:translocation and assembly module TamB